MFTLCGHSCKRCISRNTQESPMIWLITWLSLVCTPTMLSRFLKVRVSYGKGLITSNNIPQNLECYCEHLLSIKTMSIQLLNNFLLILWISMKLEVLLMCSWVVQAAYVWPRQNFKTNFLYYIIDIKKKNQKKFINLSSDLACLINISPFSCS